jgi:hypothetical protein
MKEAELDRFKFTGLDARPTEKEKKRLSVTAAGTSKDPAPTRFVECKVVPEQPLLRIRRTSLTHGAVMMYDGESYVSSARKESLSDYDILELPYV